MILVRFVLMLISFLIRLIHLMLSYNHELCDHDHICYFFFVFVQLILFVCVPDSVS